MDIKCLFKIVHALSFGNQGFNSRIGFLDPALICVRAKSVVIIEADSGYNLPRRAVNNSICKIASAENAVFRRIVFRNRREKGNRILGRNIE